MIFIIYTNFRFQSAGTTSDFVQNYINDKTFEKMNIKIVISIQQFTPLRNFSHFVELQIMGLKLPQKKYDSQQILKN